MCSDRVPDASADLTARARIRDAAIARFADEGIAGASVRAIAEDAGVSPALVIHHFQSKEGLRVACDQRVAALVRESKQAVFAQGPAFDPVAALRPHPGGPPLLRYLARTLVDGSPHVAELLDEMVEDATEYMAEGERNGMLRPTEDPRGRAVVLILWTLGPLVLHEHVRRLLGADLVSDPPEAEPYLLPALEVLSHGVITEEASTAIREAVRRQHEVKS